MKTSFLFFDEGKVPLSILMHSADSISSLMLLCDLGSADTNDKQPNQIGTCMLFLTSVQFSQNKTVNGHGIQAPLPLDLRIGTPVYP
ncbi:hypothetical protein PIL02S_06083 [Paenibacillus illinoisensis]|uniref:Uncharacterized protein n=1 Tax=Paenibacillus illinoisensis TaxID=59845 RepID=A0A2W0C2M0_9BACL|nr:hypothetical protein PIL02S_06083 [Paenibacillus illinoisensis]